ncbi:MAG: MFS transporter [Mesorhizobium sp.]|nr:MAG: MFS transporter [Mesorhizobium sp.]
MTNTDPAKGHGTAQGNHPLRLRSIPAGIWAPGFVSLLMNVSSEMIRALLPIYFVTVMGASTVTVGTVKGIGEVTAALPKIFAGALSDRLGKRKLLAVIGDADPWA